MTAIIRKFVTHWKPWAVRWVDRRMAPGYAPFFVVDCGKDGFHVGPYMTELGEMRDELVRYPDYERAQRELFFEPGDFVPAAAWVKSLEPLGKIAADLDVRLGLAKKLMSAHPPNRQEYLRTTTKMMKLALEAYRAHHQGDDPKPIPDIPILPRSAKGISDVFRARREERDRLISADAKAKFREIAGAQATARVADEDGSTL